MVAIGEPAVDPLLSECVDGDETAWRRLHQRYFAMIGSFLRKLGVDDREIEDATQEVFLMMFRYLPRFRGESELSTWLYRLCITQARQTRRRVRLRGMLGRMFSLHPVSSHVSTPSLPDDIARQRLETGLAALSELERAVFVLYEMEGQPGARIAEIVGCPEATVWRRLHYARSAFKRALGADEADGDELQSQRPLREQ